MSNKLTFKEVMVEANDTARKNGFWDREIPVSEFISQIHGEASEAWEAERVDKHADPSGVSAMVEQIENPLFGIAFENNIKNTFEDEMADIIIRVLETCQAWGIPIEDHIRLKMAYNKTRPFKHGKKC